MASVVFEDHPLQSYLQEIGEENTLPGGLGGISLELEDTCTPNIADDSWLPTFLDKIYHALDQLHSAESAQTFVERFKYTVISSSLLSTSLPPTTASLKRPHSPYPPGATHSRKSSAEHHDTTQVVNNLYWPSVAVLVVFGLGYHQVAVLAFAALALYYFQSDSSSPDMTRCLETLQDLIAANDIWDSIVQEAVSTLEKDEKCIYRDPTSSPSSTLRVALHSTLLTTQTQSDNVRQLFSALTAPNEISQISEMYAPASPPLSTIALPDLRTPEHPRPFSLPGYPTQRRSSGTTDKRSTWTGPYTTLTHAGSPTSHVLRHKAKRKSSLSSLTGSTSAPVSPALLAEVQEEGVSIPSFGAAALDLRRQRRSMSSLRRKSSLSAMTLASASRFTSFQSPRHPLSVSSIQHALQSAIAAKRYACSHLLALRFNEEYDEGYWEDVQSVISLMTSTLVDASTRLEEALEEMEQQKLEDQVPSPSPLPSKHTRRRSLSFGDESPSTTVFSLVSDERGLSARWNLGADEGSSSSFAPMPSHLARFATHVDAISSALVDARSNLELCVKSLRETAQMGQDISEEEALVAYESLRRDLGLALRECERGRERLLDVVHPPSPPPESDLPYLGMDVGSEESDPRSDDDVLQPRGVAILSYEGGANIVESDDVAELLPPMGVEQVFEADVGIEPAPFTRERSKLTREERIQLAKEKRSRPPEPQKPQMEAWGPGGDVVEELKDVIYQVGKRRRALQAPHDSPAPELTENIGIAL